MQVGSFSSSKALLMREGHSSAGHGGYRCEWSHFGAPLHHRHKKIGCTRRMRAPILLVFSLALCMGSGRGSGHQLGKGLVLTPLSPSRGRHTERQASSPAQVGGQKDRVERGNKTPKPPNRKPRRLNSLYIPVTPLNSSAPLRIHSVQDGKQALNSKKLVW